MATTMDSTVTSASLQPPRRLGRKDRATLSRTKPRAWFEAPGGEEGSEIPPRRTASTYTPLHMTRETLKGATSETPGETRMSDARANSSVAVPAAARRTSAHALATMMPTEVLVGGSGDNDVQLNVGRCWVAEGAFKCPSNGICRLWASARGSTGARVAARIAGESDVQLLRRASTSASGGQHYAGVQLSERPRTWGLVADQSASGKSSDENIRLRLRDGAYATGHSHRLGRFERTLPPNCSPKADPTGRGAIRPASNNSARYTPGAFTGLACRYGRVDAI